MLTVFICTALMVLLGYAVAMNRMLKDLLIFQCKQLEVLTKFFSNLEVIEKDKK